MSGLPTEHGGFPHAEERDALLLTVARGLGPLRLRYCPKWLTPSVKQEIALRVPHHEWFFGGAAGPGKSTALLLWTLQYVDVPGYAGIIFRKTYKQLIQEGALVDVAHDWLDGTDAVWRAGEWKWTFPSGATLSFGHMQHPDVKRDYQSAAFHRIAFDEVTDFEESSYKFMRSRVRRPARFDRFGVPRDFALSPDGLSAATVPVGIASAANPGGRGHAWVRRRFVSEATREPAAAYIPALGSENPGLDMRAYNRMLEGLGAVDRARLKFGDWSVQEEGTVFKRPAIEQRLASQADVAALRASPAVQSIRWWDMAATEETDANPDPDWTVGVRIDRDRQTGSAIVSDVIRGRWGPSEMMATIAGVAKAEGQRVTVGLEQEPGSSGKTLVDVMKRRMPGLHVVSERATGDKATRAIPVANDLETGIVRVLLAPWTQAYLDELEVFGGESAEHDDQVDGTSGAWSNIDRAAGPATIVTPKARVPGTRVRVA